MIEPLVKILAVLAVLSVMMLALAAWARWSRVNPEVVRKLLHLGMGVVVLSFPWVFTDVWPVCLLSGFATVGLIAIKMVPALRQYVGGAIHGVKRGGFGEVYYATSVGIVFALSGGQWLLFFVPMLMLTVADAVAALIGLRYGTLRYHTADGEKSAEGSIAFFTVAFFSAHVPLLLGTEIGRAETLLIALILALLVSLFESIAWGGLDNLFVPIGGFALLLLYQDMAIQPLVWRLVATAALVVFAMLWRQRTTLDDSALMASALYGYAAWMLGGWLWLIPPLGLFLLHVTIWSRTAYGGDDGRYHKVFAVLSVISAGLVCLIARVVRQEAWLVYPYAVSFGAHLAIIGISNLPRTSLHGWRRRAAAVGYLTVGWAVGFMPAFILALFLKTIETASIRVAIGQAAIAYSLIAVAGGCFFALMPRLYRPVVRPAAIHTSAAVIVLILSVASGVVFLI